MALNSTIRNDFLRSAVRHDLMTESQALQIQQECDRDDSQSAKAIAIRQGHMTGRKLDIFNALQSPEDVAPGYRISNVIGFGAFGVVYQAEQLNLSRIVALKTIPLSQFNDTSAPQRFEREAKIVGQLRHPNIVTAVDFGLHNERLYLSMEHVQGVDADLIIKDRGKFDEYTAWHIVRQVAMALAYAGDKGVVHRDIKPGNLMITNPPVGYTLPAQVPMVKVTDFGLACFHENHNRDDRLTVADATVGTPYYVSPEQFRGEEVDERSDIFSLGMTAWHLMAGQPPMHGATPSRILKSKINGDDQWHDEMPDGWSDAGGQLLRKMCAFDPQQRPDNHATLIDSIDNVLSTIDSGDHQVTSPSSMTRLNNDGGLDFGKPHQDPNLETRIEPGTTHVPDVSELQKSGQDQIKSTENPKRIPGWPTSKWIVASVVTALLIGVIAAGYWVVMSGTNNTDPNKPQAKKTEIKEIELTQLGEPLVRLFNGTSLNPRQKSSGKWSTGMDDEGAYVLVGQGTENSASTRVLKCKDDRGHFRFFRLNVSFQQIDAKVVEFVLESEQSGKLGRVTVDREQALLVDLISGSSKPVDTPIKLEDFDSEKPKLYQLRIERHVNYWHVHFDGRSIGKIPVPENSPASVELVVRGKGKAFFSDIYVSPFKNAQTDAPGKSKK